MIKTSTFNREQAVMLDGMAKRTILSFIAHLWTPGVAPKTVRSGNLLRRAGQAIYDATVLRPIVKARLATSALVAGLGTLGSVGAAMAQVPPPDAGKPGSNWLADNGGIADTNKSAYIDGALASNQAAYSELAASSFTAGGVQTSSQNVVNAILYVAGALGIILTLFGIFTVWKHHRDGDQARGDASTGWWMVGIGGLCTIPAIITMIAPNLFINEGGGVAATP